MLHAAAPWAFGKPGDRKAWAGRYDAIDQRRAFNDLFRDLFVQASYQLFHPGKALRDLSGKAPEDLWDRDTRRRFSVAIFLDDLDRCHPERVLEVLTHSEIFKQAYYVADSEWVADDYRFKPDYELVLEDEGKVFEYPPIYNTLTQFSEGYDRFVQRLLERKERLNLSS